MHCKNPEKMKKSILYVYDALPEEEKKRIASHVLTCDVCFNRMYLLSQFFNRMQIQDARTLLNSR